MDERALRAGVRDLEDAALPDDAFVERLHGRLLAEAGFRPAAADPGDDRAGASAPSGRTRRPGLRLLLAAALPVVAAGAIVAVAAATERLAPRPDLFASLQRAGHVDVIVPEGPPQVALPRGGWTGLDVDAAALIARRLGLEAATGVAPGGVPAQGTAWDLAVLAGPPPEGTSPLLLTDPFGWWPVRLVVTEGDAATGLDALPGAAVCAAAGSDAERWLRGEPLRDALPLREAPDVQVATATDEAACRAALVDGSVAAMASGISAADLQGDATLQAVGDPVLLLPRRMAVRDDGGGADLRDALDLVIAGALADGSLADVSRRRLGGEDITVRPDPSARP